MKTREISRKDLLWKAPPNFGKSYVTFAPRSGSAHPSRPTLRGWNQLLGDADGLRTVAAARSDMILLQVYSDELDRNLTPASVRIRLRIVTEGIEMCQVIPDRGEGL